MLNILYSDIIHRTFLFSSFCCVRFRKPRLRIFFIALACFCNIVINVQVLFKLYDIRYRFLMQFQCCDFCYVYSTFISLGCNILFDKFHFCMYSCQPNCCASSSAGIQCLKLNLYISHHF